MKNPIPLQLPREINKSFVVFNEHGTYFPCPWHFHPEYELCLVTKSTGRRMVGDHIGNFKEDDLVFMGSMLPHVWVNDPMYMKDNSTLEVDAIVIHFKEDFLGRSFFEKPEMSSMKEKLSLSKRGMVIKGQTREKINYIMKKMVKMNGIQRLSSLLEIFDILSQSSEYTLLASPKYQDQEIIKNKTNRLDVVLEYMMRKFDEEISLNEVAKMANMGLTTFCNTFKDNYRLTFIEYLNVIRIGHACKLLAEDSLTITEIAYSCGFNTIANFNRQFKKYKEMSPSEFKMQLNISSNAMRDSFKKEEYLSRV